MDGIKVNALMLRAVDYKDNDKILTLLTAERGRITAGIKGVKKSTAKLRFAAQPFCFAEYILSERGGRYTVTQADEQESFYELRSDVGKYYAACVVAECAIALTEEGEGAEGIFSAAVSALRDICVRSEKPALIKFILSAVRAAGYGLVLKQYCPVCGTSLVGAPALMFDMDSATFACRDCIKGAGVSAVTLNALFSVEGKQNFTAEAEGEKRALKLLREYLRRKLGAPLKAFSEYIDMECQ